MSNLIFETDFEPGMCLLVDTLASCIRNNYRGFINKKVDNFSVQFVFMGAEGVKRKPDNHMFGVAKKMRKLACSLENLLLDTTETDEIKLNDCDVPFSTETLDNIKIEGKPKAVREMCTVFEYRKNNNVLHTLPLYLLH